jgi:hypothetical protein
MKIKISHIAIAALTLALLISIVTCRRHVAKERHTQAVLDTTLAAFKVIKNKAGQQVVEQQPAQFTNGKPLKQASAAAFNLPKAEERKIKSVDHFVQIEQHLSVENDSTPVEISDSVFSFRFDRPNYKVTGRVYRTMSFLDSLAVYNTISLRFADKKTGLFKRELVVQAVNSNPYVINTGIQSMTVEQRPTIWNQYIKPALFAAGGFAAGRALK